MPLDLLVALARGVFQTLAVYLFLIAGLRILGRRQIGQLNVIDLVIIIVLGSAVETAMIAGDTSLSAGLVSTGVVVTQFREVQTDLEDAFMTVAKHAENGASDGQ